MSDTKKTTLEIFKQKAAAALKRKRSFTKFQISFPSFKEDENDEPMIITFRPLSDAEVNDSLDYDPDSRTAADKYVVYTSSVEPSLKDLGVALKEAGEITTAFEIMEMFDMHEVTEAATIIMEKSGVIGKNKATLVEKRVEDLKNL